MDRILSQHCSCTVQYTREAASLQPCVVFIYTYGQGSLFFINQSSFCRGLIKSRQHYFIHSVLNCLRKNYTVISKQGSMY
jgi:hypothetical protein